MDHQNAFSRLQLLNEKLHLLLKEVQTGRANFSVLERDLLLAYVKELYEVALSVQPGEGLARNPEKEIIVRQEKLSAEQEVSGNKNQKPEEVKKTDSAENKEGLRKTLSELYADRHGAATVNDKLRKQSPQIADKLKQTRIHDLKAYIGLNKRMAYTRAFFKGDETLYDETISRINSFSSYEEAVGYLNAAAPSQPAWDKHPELAEEFFGLLMRRYLK